MSFVLIVSNLLEPIIITDATRSGRMPTLRMYLVFICHDWEYSDDYYRICQFLNDAPNFAWTNLSVPNTIRSTQATCWRRTSETRFAPPT